MEAIVQTHLSVPLNVSPILHRRKWKDLFLRSSGRNRVNIWFEREEIRLGVCGFIDRAQQAVAQMETCVT